MLVDVGGGGGVHDASFGDDEERYALAAAGVHALLAQTAATIETAASRGPGDVSDAWRAAVETPAPPYRSPDVLGPG